jgi:hypothetical protein
MLVMFVLITICFYDLEYYETEERKTPSEESPIPSGIPEEDDPKNQLVP